MDIVIYTAVFGNYDILAEPKIINPKVKYICFSDEKLDCPPWEVIVVKPEFKDLRLENRKYKILAHKFLNNYKYSIYLDANYTILCDLSIYVEEWLGDNDIAVQKHPSRNCIYEEAKKCIIAKIDSRKKIKKQIKKYKKEGYPPDYGLTDNGLIIRKHTEKIKEFNNAWWDEINNHSIRDQISFKYIAYKLKIDYSVIPIPSQRIGKSNYIKMREHYYKVKKIRDEKIKMKELEFKLNYLKEKILIIFPPFLQTRIDRIFKVRNLAEFLAQNKKLLKIKNSIIKYLNV
ncbi:MAG: glycosyltransferase domain-containing protein [Promethearchaeota archaeon]